MPPDQAMTAAKMFVSTRLPPGLPLSEARDRLAHAGMRCRRPHGVAAPTECDFTELVHNDGGVIGEAHFRVTLVSVGGAILSAELQRFNVGTGNSNP